MAFGVDGFGRLDLNTRKEVVDQMVKGFALQRFVMKPLTTVSRASGWDMTYFEEDPTVPTARGTKNIKGVPRGAEFPSLQIQHKRRTSTEVKHAGRDVIDMEDMKFGELDALSRGSQRIGHAIAKSVDTAIYTDMHQASNVNSFGATAPWATTGSANPFKDLLKAKRLIGTNFYDTTNLTAVFNENGFENLLNYLVVTKGSSIPQFASQRVVNGVMGELAGIKIAITETALNSQAMIVADKKAATYQEAMPLTVVTKENELISTEIRAAEIGVTQVTDPKAISIISNI